MGVAAVVIVLVSTTMAIGLCEHFELVTALAAVEVTLLFFIIVDGLYQS